MPVVVIPEQIDQPCAELWADPDVLINDAVDDEGLDDFTVLEAITEATWLLWRLTHERFHGYQCWVEDYLVRRGGCAIRLDQWPVDEVLSVSRVDVCADDVAATGVGDEVAGWCYKAGLVKVCCAGGIDGEPRFGSSGCGCSSTGSVIRVHYRTRPNLPPGADKATTRLAREFIASRTGGECSLPERITSVTRQGVSWTILDPQDFLQNGLTGIGPVDAWISAANGKGVAALIDPLNRPTLHASTLVACGPGCTS